MPMMLIPCIMGGIVDTVKKNAEILVAAPK